jgi:hypothetical protein
MMPPIFLRDTTQDTSEDSKTVENLLWMATESKHMLDPPPSLMNFSGDQTLLLSIAARL